MVFRYILLYMAKFCRTWIPLPGDIPKELALRAEEICQHYGVHRSNSDDLIKVPVCICMCMCKKIYTYT